MLAAQIRTVREFYRDHPERLPEACRRIRSIGYGAIEVIKPFVVEPWEYRRIVEGAGLTICSVHVDADNVFGDPAAIAALKEEWGTDQFVITSMPGPLRGDAEGARLFAAELERAGERLARAGIALSYHNHDFEFQKFGGKTVLETICELTKPEHVKIQLDTYWVQHGGGNVAAWIRRLGARITSLHMKDMAMRLREPIPAEVGEGNLNWPAILDAARDVGVRRFIVEQETCQRDPFDSLALSHRNCTAMGLQ